MTKHISPIQRVLSTWGAVLIIWSIYRVNFQLPDYIDEFIAKPLVFLVPVLIYIVKIEKKPILESIGLRGKNILPDIAIGVSLGVLFIASGLAAQYTKSGAIHLPAMFTDKNLLMLVAITLATSISEEVLSRGFVLQRLYNESKNPYMAAFITSLLFLILHIPILLTNYHLSGPLLLLFFGTDFVLSLINSFVYLDRRSIVGPILIHALYNLSTYMYM